jgi:HSP20 family protein
VHWQEIPYGRFERTIPLPSAVDKNSVKTQFKNGVLEIRISKPSTKTRTIHVDVSR